MNEAKKDESDLSALLCAACNMCAKRDGCMPYSDEQLVYGVQNGHVPKIGECEYYQEGTGFMKETALDNLADFNDYAKSLVKSLGT